MNIPSSRRTHWVSKSHEALVRAVHIVGGQAPLARAIGSPVRQGHVWQWLNRAGRVVPGEHCIPIETATNGKVTRYDLRPDIFGDGPRQEVAA